VGDPPSKPTASWIALELRVADRVAGGADCSSGVEIVSAWKRRLDVPRGCGLMNRGLGGVDSIWGCRMRSRGCCRYQNYGWPREDDRAEACGKKTAGGQFRDQLATGNWQRPRPSHSFYTGACIYAISMGYCRNLTVLWISSWQLFACAVKLPRCLAASLSNSLVLDKATLSPKILNEAEHSKYCVSE